ncbi:MAG: hypothetical protein A2902_00025 [Elusimicrobia bacterium RIFCSPLOWO2_01_FULL_64_13]|nr:MAG: hypothetical protein A2636_00550 [Elusimicrobia bacterium RIFCSPHIGHO2_01_FULL_64_10]OGR97969.1 MAG: hypothetical protein A2902_00025 [Elusimicrobia bacterium RIFCSPLOWO2_01_FULL_64_13]
MTSKSLPSFEAALLQSAGEMAESLSISRLVGQIYALLYIRPGPVSLDDMARTLQISKGSASVNIRILEDWSAVKQVVVSGSRKDFYTAEPDFVKVVSERLSQGFSRRLNYADEKLRLIESLVPPEPFYRERLKQLKDLRDLLEGALKILPRVRSAKGLGWLKALL